jgi:hypothetical protein
MEFRYLYISLTALIRTRKYWLFAGLRHFRSHIFKSILIVVLMTFRRTLWLPVLDSIASAYLGKNTPSASSIVDLVVALRDAINELG